MPIFERPDFSMHYEVTEGLLPQDTLFLHGNLASNLWWEPARSEWKKRAGGPGRMILAEWRGCGGSRTFSGDLCIQRMASDYLALLDHLKATKVSLVGHSTGGLIGLHLMALASDRFSRALLLDSVSPEGVRFGTFGRKVLRQMRTDKTFCASQVLGSIQGGRESNEFYQSLVDAAFSVAPQVWEQIPDLLEAPPPLALDSLRFPILVAHGKHDAVLPLQKSLALAKSLPEGTFHQLDSGHSINVEEPVRFVDLAHSFLYSA